MSGSLAVLIATTGRPEIVADLVHSLFAQTRPPDRLICVGATPADIAGIAPRSEVVATLGRRGTAHQRNDALDRGAGFETIVFFDDDFAPSRFWLERAEALFQRRPDLACLTGEMLADGARGPGISPRDARAMVFARDVDPGEIDETVDPAFGPQGSNMAFRGSAIADLRFDERLQLYAWLEDRDFGERVRARGGYGKAAALWGVHMGAKGGRTAGVRLGYSQVANAAYLAGKGTLRTRDAARLVFGQFAANLARSARPEAWIDRRGRLRGNLLALADALKGRMAPERVLML